MHLTIDNKPVEIRDGATILDAARRHGIPIPSLCSHPELTPFGGCRLCIVEVDGMRGFPTACTTRAEEGMTVRTVTGEIQQLRRDILQLILSEHPASCLMCEEAEACSSFQTTIRKSGATTGCRNCPNDAQCELQKVVESVGLDDIAYPIYYRNIPVEKDDPFYDRDYNLCILCGRCVRICQEVRMNGTLAFTQRGRRTTIGPAFDRSHLEAGCEFCGACLSVCPTGTLAEKGRKWAGAPDAATASPCPFCGLACDLQVLTKRDRIIGTLPPDTETSSGGELCVKGRFCLAEFANHPDRLSEPTMRVDGGMKDVSMEEAVQRAAGILKGVEGRAFAMLLSPDLSLEDLWVAGRFAREVMKSPNIASSAVEAMGPALGAYLTLAGGNRISDIEESGLIVSIAADFGYAFAPAALRLKRAVKGGSRYVRVGPVEDSTTPFAHKDFPLPLKEEADFIEGVAASEERPLFILGPDLLFLDNADTILGALLQRKESGQARVLALLPHHNLFGLAALFGDALHSDVSALLNDGKIIILYSLEGLFMEKRPAAETLIHQNAFRPASLSADLVLPSAGLGEASGTVLTLEGKPIAFQQAVGPRGSALPDWKILTMIATAMGRSDFHYQCVEEIRREMPPTFALKPFPLSKKPGRKTAIKAPSKAFPFLLHQRPAHESFRGVALSSKVSGFADLFPPGHVFINKRDAASLDIRDGDAVCVEAHGMAAEFLARLSPGMEPKMLYVIGTDNPVKFPADPCAVNLRRR
jgi:predicted molibdopterin-dependent oxidoreductase YjgC